MPLCDRNRYTEPQVTKVDKFWPTGKMHRPRIVLAISPLCRSLKACACWMLPIRRYSRSQAIEFLALFRLSMACRLALLIRAFRPARTGPSRCLCVWRHAASRCNFPIRVGSALLRSMRNGRTLFLIHCQAYFYPWCRLDSSRRYVNCKPCAKFPRHASSNTIT